MRRLIFSTLLAIALAASTSCTTLRGPRAKHTAIVTVVSAHAVLAAVQDTEVTLVCGRSMAPAPPACVTADVHHRVSVALERAFATNVQVDRLIRALPPGGFSQEVLTLLGQIAAIVDEVLGLIPSSDAKRGLVARVSQGG